MENLKEIYDNFNNEILKCNDKNNYENKSDEQTINLIHQNIKNISENKMLAKEFFDLICSHDILIKECLTFDLLNYNPKESEKTNNIDTIIDIAKNTFKKYQYKIGGSSIEDIDWIISDETCKRFKVKENNKILYNSVHKKKCDKELIWFLDSILDYLKKFILNQEIKISYSIFEDERNCVCWIIYKFKK